MRRDPTTDASRVAARIVACVALAVALPPTALASPPGPQLQEARIIASDLAELEALRGLPLTVDHGVRGYADGSFSVPVITEGSVLDALRAAGRGVELVREHRRGPPPEAYRSPEEGGALLRDLAAGHDRAGYAVLGTSVEGRPLDALWLGQPPTSGAPVFRVLGAHHGDEWSSFELCLAIAETLLARDGSDPDVTAWLDTSTLWVVPYVNPDGVVAGSRYNANLVDLNRNYDFEWSGTEYASGPAAFSEPETRAVRAAFFYDPPLTGLSMHSGAVNIGYVWNWTTAPADDLPVIAELAWDYAATTTAHDFWVTNGAAWYVTYGDTNDWSYGRYGALDYTVELTSVKAPPSDDIAEFVGEHLEASLSFLQLAPDLAGRVVDALTGDPLSARLRLLDEEGVVRSAWFTTDPESGTFHRLLAPQASRLEISAPGWQARELGLDELVGDVALERDTLAEGRLAPTVFSGGGAVLLPDATNGLVLLHRTGHASTSALATGGELFVAGLAAGAWSVELPDGKILPNALLVTGEGRATLTEVWLEDDLLVLTGDDLGPGTRAWVLQGAVRAHEPLSVVEESPNELVIDLSTIPEDATADVLILTAGTHLAVGDVRSVAEPAGLSPGRPRLAGGGGCACDAGHRFAGPLSHPLGFLIFGSILSLGSRRRRS